MIEKIIPSKYVQMYMSKENIQLQDIDLATIIYHAPLPVSQTHQLLKELATKTENPDLKKQIDQRLAYDQMSIERFLNNDGSCFYETYASDGNIIGHFATIDLAKNHALSLGTVFSVQKYQIIGLCKDIIVPHYAYNPRLFSKGTTGAQSYTGDAISGCRYDVAGQLLDCWSYEMTAEETAIIEDWGANRFEWRFVRLPNPFEYGDAVRSTNTNRMGVVRTSQDEWKQLLQTVEEGKLVCDYTDASITVEFPEKDGVHSHEHIQPIYLEKYNQRENHNGKN